MKLSTAIREGARFGPQAFGWFGGKGGATCAIGAAALGFKADIGLFGYGSEGQRLIDVAPILAHDCPCGEQIKTCSTIFGPDHTIWTHIVSLNDIARWTREQIADWVEALEQADEAGKRALEAVTEKELVAVG